MKRLYRIAACAALALALTASVTWIAPVSVSADEFKITICHATGNVGHWNDITVSVNAAAGVPTSEEIYEELAQSGHFDAAGQPVHFRNWGGQDFWLEGDVDSKACDDAGGGK